MADSSRVAVIGATGQLGSDLVEVLSQRYEVVGFSHAELEVTDPVSLEQTLGSQAWAAILNTAALHKVETCEAEPARSFQVNSLGALNVAQVARKTGARYVYISTDYVFNGSKNQPYLESDAPQPINVYGVSKLAGEQLSLLAQPNTLVLRIASVFGKAGASGKGGNFIEAILRKARSGEPLAVVADQFMSPSYTRDVARLLMHLLEQDATGLFHGANAGVCSWHAFAQEAVRLCELDIPVEPIPASRFPSTARRPAYSALSSERLPRLGLQMRPWQEALYEYLVEKGHIPA